jgi:hypothetical protein
MGVGGDKFTHGLPVMSTNGNPVSGLFVVQEISTQVLLRNPTDVLDPMWKEKACAPNLQQDIS